MIMSCQTYEKNAGKQQGRIKHRIKAVIAIVLFASTSNANEWTEIHAFAEMNEKLLREYTEFPNGIPLHGTIQRVIAVVPALFLQNLQAAWIGMLSENEREKFKKILAIDGKMMRGS